MTDNPDISTGPTFFSLWRPALGYISVGALALQFIVFPLTEGIFAVFGHKVTLPRMDLGPLVSLIVGVLGLAGARTFEKYAGIQGNH